MKAFAGLTMGFALGITTINIPAAIALAVLAIALVKQ